MNNHAVLLSRLTLSLVRTIAATALSADRFGASADDVVLACAIYIGYAEGRPMTAAKLADYAGIPRPTVVRKLRAMAAAGVVQLDDDGRVLVGPVASSHAVIDGIRKNSSAVIECGRKLSILDGLSID